MNLDYNEENDEEILKAQDEYIDSIIFWFIFNRKTLWDILIIFFGASGALYLAYSIVPTYSLRIGHLPVGEVIQSRFSNGITLILISYLLQLLPLFSTPDRIIKIFKKIKLFRFFLKK